jgi:hypothetical protein
MHIFPLDGVFVNGERFHKSVALLRPPPSIGKQDAGGFHIGLVLAEYRVSRFKPVDHREGRSARPAGFRGKAASKEAEHEQGQGHKKRQGDPPCLSGNLPALRGVPPFSNEKTQRPSGKRPPSSPAVFHYKETA